MLKLRTNWSNWTDTWIWPSVIYWLPG